MSHDWIGPWDLHKVAMISGPQPQPPGWWRSLELVTFGEWRWVRRGSMYLGVLSKFSVTKELTPEGLGGSESDGGCWGCQWKECFQQQALDLNTSEGVWAGPSQPEIVAGNWGHLAVFWGLLSPGWDSALEVSNLEKSQKASLGSPEALKVCLSPFPRPGGTFSSGNTPVTQTLYLSSYLMFINTCRIKQYGEVKFIFLILLRRIPLSEQIPQAEGHIQIIKIKFRISFVGYLSPPQNYLNC